MKNLEIFRNFLKKRQLSVTEECLGIAGAALEFGNQIFSVEDVHLKINNQGFLMAKSTVYRNIKLLRSAGIIEPISSGINGKAGFQNIDPQKLTCKICCLYQFAFYYRLFTK